MNTIREQQVGYSFTKGLERAKTRLAYYEEDLLIETSARIIDAMERRGVTRSELAGLMDVSPAYVTKILRGHANLSLESLAKVAFALDLKWECLLIPKNARLGLFALLSDDADGVAIRTVETATLMGLGGDPKPSSKTEYAKEHYKEQHYELPVPA